MGKISGQVKGLIRKTPLSSRRNNTTVSSNKALYLLAMVFLCLMVGKSISVVPTGVPFTVILCVVLFFIGFVKVNLAAVLLIGAMLLSPEIKLGQLPGQDIVLRLEDLLIVVFGLSWIFRMGLVRKTDFLTRTPLNRYIVFFASVFTLVTLRGMLMEYVTPLKGFFFILKYFEYFMIYFFAGSILRSKDQVRLFIKAFLLTYVIISIYAMTRIGLEGRVSAPFEGEGEPNTLGGYLVLLQAIILGLLVHLRLAKQRIILALLFLVSLLPFVFTFSRASYSAFVPMYLTVVFLNKTRKRNLLIGAMIVTVVLGIFFFPSNVKERLGQTFRPEVTYDSPPQNILGVPLGPSASARVYSWKTMIERWKSKPFLGYGVTGQGFIDGQYIRNLVEMGALGLVAFLLLLFAILRQTLRIYDTSKDDLYRGIALGFLAGHIGMMIHAIPTNTYVLIRIMEPYWFLAAIVMAIPRLEQMEAKEIETESEKQTPEKTFRNVNMLLANNRPG